MWHTFRTLLKRLLLFIATGSTAVFIAACYGLPVGYYDSLRSWLINVKNSKNQPVKGLRVTVLNNLQRTDRRDTIDVLYTDSLGQCSFGFLDHDDSTYIRRDSTFSIVVTDQDGALNGGPYKTRILALPRGDQYEPRQITVVVEE